MGITSDDSVQFRSYFDADMDKPESHVFCAGEVTVFSAGCPGEAGVNQDSAALITFGQTSGILVVADGLGGSRGGAVASQTAIEELTMSLQQARDHNQSLRDAVMTGFERANRRVRDHGSGGGTTLAIAEIHSGAMRPFHVGDSAILVFGRGGRCRFQSLAHSPVSYAVEAGLLDAGEAIHHENLHLISNCLGGEQARIDVGSAIRLKTHDTVLLASDGLMDNVSVDEVISISRKGELEMAALELARLCRQRMVEPVSGEPSKSDDLTFILYRGRA